MARLEDCCRSCDCQDVVVCLGDHWPPNTCLHGLAICEECSPGECVECALELGLRDWGVVA